MDAGRKSLETKYVFLKKFFFLNSQGEFLEESIRKKKGRKVYEFLLNQNLLNLIDEKKKC